MESIRDILIWCRSFPENIDALPRAGSLNTNRMNDELFCEWIGTLLRLLRLLSSGMVRQNSFLRDSAISSLTNLIKYSKMPTFLRNAVGLRFIAWLRRWDIFDETAATGMLAQRSELYELVIELLDTGQLAIERDRPDIERFLRWTDSWSAEKKEYLDVALYTLRDRYPVPGLWDLVTGVDPMKT